jgi:serine/threonine protein phosphatase PrpC
VGTNGDNPMKGESFAHDVKHGDIVVMGTDGLFDNIHRAVIVDMIKPYVSWTEG